MPGPAHGPDEDRPPIWPRLGRQLGWLVVALVAAGVIGFGAGWLYATITGSNPLPTPPPEAPGEPADA